MDQIDTDHVEAATAAQMILSTSGPLTDRGVVGVARTKVFAVQGIEGSGYHFKLVRVTFKYYAQATVPFISAHLELHAVSRSPSGNYATSIQLLNAQGGAIALINLGRVDLGCGGDGNGVRRVVRHVRIATAAGDPRINPIPPDFIERMAAVSVQMQGSWSDHTTVARYINEESMITGDDGRTKNAAMTVRTNYDEGVELRLGISLTHHALPAEQYCTLIVDWHANSRGHGTTDAWALEVSFLDGNDVLVDSIVAGNWAQWGRNPTSPAAPLHIDLLAPGESTRSSYPKAQFDLIRKVRVATTGKIHPN